MRGQVVSQWLCISSGPVLIDSVRAPIVFADGDPHPEGAGYKVGAHGGPAN